MSGIPVNLSRLERMIISEYQDDARIVGEEANIGITFHILVTKDFRRELRLHEVIISLSGAGKSTLSEGIVKPFREQRKEDVIDVVRMTGSALERSESLDGKILMLSQTLGNEPTSVRPLLSEGKLGLMVTERKEGSNKFETEIHEVNGMPSFLSTSTDPNIDAELLRRVVQRTVDESAEQTKRIKQSQALHASTIQLPKLTKFIFIKAILEKLGNERPQNIDKVVIPYASEIESKLPDDVEIRSKLPQFLNLIASIAIVKACCYRGYFEIKAEKALPQRVVLATKEDFSDALFLAGAGFFHLIPATGQAIIDFLAGQIEGEGSLESYKKCTIRDIQTKLKIHNSTIAKYANSLADRGLIIKEKTTKDDTKVELNLYQYLPGTIVDTGLELNGFDYKSWFQSTIVEKGFKLTYLKIENPLEIELFAQKRGMSDSCVIIGQTPMSTHEKEVSRIETKSSTINEKTYCKACDTDYGKKYAEHIRLAHKEIDPNKEASPN